MPKRFILGSVNQGNLQVGNSYSAYKQNTIFFSDACLGNDYLDEPAEDAAARGFLKNIGSLYLKLSRITELGEGVKVAELEMHQESAERYQILCEYLFDENYIGYYHQKPTLMTMSPCTALNVGDELSIGYISVLKPLGEGEYKLMHDYPIERTQGPRYEIF